jgi:hypothetical protein
VNPIPWEKAVAQNSFLPEMLADPGLSNIHVTLFTDYLDRLADAKFGAGRWVKRDDVRLEEFEPFTRDMVYEDTDEESETFGQTIHYHDDGRYFRMSAWFRAKAPSELDADPATTADWSPTGIRNTPGWSVLE